MTAYKLKITFVTNGKEYQPGDILPADISSSDFDFLKSKKFIEVADISEEEDYEESDDYFDGFGKGIFKLMSVEEIKRIRSKKDAAAYAELIGLDMGDYAKKSLKELQEEIINYQEEYEDDEDNQGGEGDGDDQNGQEDESDGDDQVPAE